MWGFGESGIRRVGAWPGETLLDAIQRHHIPGIPAECQGGDKEFPAWVQPYDYYSTGVHCGKCAVNIPDPWNGRIYVPDTEKQVLEMKDTDTVTRE